MSQVMHTDYCATSMTVKLVCTGIRQFLVLVLGGCCVHAKKLVEQYCNSIKGDSVY